MLRAAWAHRDFALSLARRQYLLRYRQSAVGLAWAILPPFATLAMATLVFDKVAHIDTGDVPYPLFALSGLAPWALLSSGLSSGIPSVSQFSQMVTRLPFPRAVIPVSMIMMAGIDLAVSVAGFIVFTYATGAALPATIVWFPVPLAIEIVLVLGLALFGAALNVFARDVRLAVPLLIQLWLFLTPVMYPLESVPEKLRPVYLANPMTGVIESFRNIMVRGLPPDFNLLGASLIGAVVALALGLWYFGATEKRFADVI